jgi:hypothetical protein
MITCAVLMIIMLVGCQTNTANSEATTKMPDPTTQTSEPFSFSKLKEATLMTVLEVPVGTADGELSYGDIGDNGVAASGPSDFAVAANGDVYILDNYHGNGDDRISVYSQGKWERDIDYSAIIAYGINLTIFDDNLYVFDHNYYQGDAYIIKMTLAGELQDKYVFSSEDTPIDVWRLIAIDDRVVVVTYNACYELDDSAKKAIKSNMLVSDEFADMYRRKVTFGHSSWTVLIENRQILPTPIGKTDKDELFVAYGGNEYICKCDVTGEPVSIVKLDELLKETVYIRSSFYVAADGTLYIMVGHQDAVRVYKVQ